MARVFEDLGKILSPVAGKLNALGISGELLAETVFNFFYTGRPDPSVPRVVLSALRGFLRTSYAKRTLAKTRGSTHESIIATGVFLRMLVLKLASRGARVFTEPRWERMVLGSRLLITTVLGASGLQAGRTDALGDLVRVAVKHVDNQVVWDIIRYARRVKFAEGIGLGGEMLWWRGEELHSYSLTRNVERALPREHALPREVYDAKLLSQGLTALLRNLPSQVKEIIMVLDDSDSMEKKGRLQLSRGLALAILSSLMTRTRIGVMRYTAEPHRLVWANPNSPGEAVDEILYHKEHGGTNTLLALHKALDNISNNGMIILMTDAIDIVRRDRVEFLAKRIIEKNVTLITLVIGREPKKNDMVHVLSQMLDKEARGQLLTVTTSGQMIRILRNNVTEKKYSFY